MLFKAAAYKGFAVILNDTSLNEQARALLTSRMHGYRQQCRVVAALATLFLAVPMLAAGQAYMSGTGQWPVGLAWGLLILLAVPAAIYGLAWYLRSKMLRLRQVLREDSMSVVHGRLQSIQRQGAVDMFAPLDLVNTLGGAPISFGGKRVSYVVDGQAYECTLDLPAAYYFKGQLTVARLQSTRPNPKVILNIIANTWLAGVRHTAFHHPVGVDESLQDTEWQSIEDKLIDYFMGWVGFGIVAMLGFYGLFRWVAGSVSTEMMMMTLAAIAIACLLSGVSEIKVMMLLRRRKEPGIVKRTLRGTASEIMVTRTRSLSGNVFDYHLWARLGECWHQLGKTAAWTADEHYPLTLDGEVSVEYIAKDADLLHPLRSTYQLVLPRF